jgi:hypothetical protein
MKRLLCVLTVLIFSHASGSGLHKRPTDFHNGIVVLHSGDTVKCKLKFTRKVAEGLIQVFSDDRIEILTVKQVRYFSFEDRQKKQVRTFYNISITPDLSTRRHEVFVELLYGGADILILNHKSLGFSDKAIQINPFRKKEVINRQYLFSKKTGIALPMSEENILAMMEEKKEEILPYLESSGLKLKSVADYIRLLDYHQSLL